MIVLKWFIIMIDIKLFEWKTKLIHVLKRWLTKTKRTKDNTESIAIFWKIHSLIHMILKSSNQCSKHNIKGKNKDKETHSKPVYGWSQMLRKWRQFPICIYKICTSKRFQSEFYISILYLIFTPNRSRL